MFRSLWWLDWRMMNKAIPNNMSNSLFRIRAEVKSEFSVSAKCASVFYLQESTPLALVKIAVVRPFIV